MQPLLQMDLSHAQRTRSNKKRADGSSKTKRAAVGSNAAFEPNGGPNVRGFFAKWDRGLSQIRKDLHDEACLMGQEREKIGRDKIALGMAPSDVPPQILFHLDNGPGGGSENGEQKGGGRGSAGESCSPDNRAKRFSSKYAAYYPTTSSTGAPPPPAHGSKFPTTGADDSEYSTTTSPRPRRKSVNSYNYDEQTPTRKPPNVGTSSGGATASNFYRHATSTSANRGQHKTTGSKSTANNKARSSPANRNTGTSGASTRKTRRGPAARMYDFDHDFPDGIGDTIGDDDDFGLFYDDNPYLGGPDLASAAEYRSMWREHDDDFRKFQEQAPAPAEPDIQDGERPNNVVASSPPPESSSTKLSALRYEDIPWPPVASDILEFCESIWSPGHPKQAYRIACRRWHPDKFLALYGHRIESPVEREKIQSKLTEVFQQIQQAHEKRSRHIATRVRGS
ncbi:unnamed protein product [Amoebophrya sp. A25]|nr:unnamed protein product [Amoebophrya sp. A25]|eukprot:GSA25T00013914001.1